MDKKEIIIDLADVDGFFNDFDAATIQLWKDQGLNIVENEDGLHVAVKFDVSDLDNIKPISQQDEAIVRSIENSFINFNSDEIKREAHDYHAFFKKEIADSIEKLRASNQDLDIVLDENGDILIDYRIDDDAYFAGSENIPATKAIAFSVPAAEELADRMIAEKQQRSRTLNGVYLDVDYDFISDHTLKKILPLLHDEPHSYKVTGYTINGCQRHFALSQELPGIISKEIQTNALREVIVAETQRHIEIITNYFMSLRILFLKNPEGKGIHVGFYNSSAFDPKKQAHWLEQNLVAATYQEATLIAIMLLNDCTSNEGGKGAEELIAGSPMPPYVKKQMMAMNKKIKHQANTKKNSAKKNKVAAEIKSHGFIIDSEKPVLETASTQIAVS